MTHDHLDDQIAELLEAGHTNTSIQAALKVGGDRVTRVLRERGITQPPGRAKRPRAEITAAEDQAVRMLQDGATVRQTTAATRISPNRLAALRAQHHIPTTRPTPPRPPSRTRRTFPDAIALHTEPYGDGHTRWTGPVTNGHPVVCAEGTRISVRPYQFRTHHQRQPDGHITPNCGQHDCITGAHLTDRTIREANKRADHAFEQIFGKKEVQ